MKQKTEVNAAKTTYSCQIINLLQKKFEHSAVPPQPNAQIFNRKLSARQ